MSDPTKDTKMGLDEEVSTSQEKPDQPDQKMDQDVVDNHPEDQDAEGKGQDQPLSADSTDKEPDTDEQGADSYLDADQEQADQLADDTGEKSNTNSAVAQTPAADVEKKPASTPPATEETTEELGQEMTFTAHLNELRIRLTRALIGIFVGFLACYGFAEQLFRKLMEPLIILLQPKDGTLIYTGLPEAFFTHVKVAAVAGLFVASPYVFYQIWMFIAPGLYESERKWMIPIALCSAILFVTGALFGYYIVFPFGFQFFLGYATDFVTPMPSLREYFSFSVTMLFAFGLIFELPLFIFFLARLGLVTHKTLRKYQKYAMLGNFIVGAILTPPDVVSQVLMALPLCVLYEVGIWIAFIFGRKPKDKETEGEGAKA